MAYLISYACRKRGNLQWEFANDVSSVSPLEWLAEFIQMEKEALTPGVVVLLSATPCEEEQAVLLRDLL